MTTSTLTRADLNDPQLREEVQKLVPGARDTHGDTTEISFFLQVQGKDSEELGPKLSGLIRELIAAVRSGEDLAIVSQARVFTTTAAAKELGISRPTLVKMIRNGEIPAHKVGSHFRIMREDLESYQRAQLERQKQALMKIWDIEAELGIRE